MKNVPFKGIIAYPITPFDQNEKVDITLFKKLVERLIVSGIHGIAPLGSTGVMPYLSDEEKEAITEASIQQTKGRVPTLVGVSNLTTEKTVHHARFAEKAGADAVMIIPMSYWKLTDDEIVAHYDAVARKISIPIMAYNNPATSGVDMSPALLKRLLEISNVTMIKESTGDIQRMHYLRKELGEETAFYNGSNPLALAAFTAGARGWCTAAPNLIPELTIELYHAIEEGNLEKAKDVFYQQFDLLKFIVSKGLPRAVKAGLNILGEEGGNLRSPLQPLTEKDTEELKNIIKTVLN
ncbi:dihydrodipicolinate synthase family protein [Chryseobacterium carnipullorum]|uniref:Dihydrodipicolinate synthase n=1 Tax=Chryseobacterium carnipullorum TaxID=1124835 RepID=A0A1M7IKY0_CHRCU|nr:dihydrodipicolinate synthase family protein [Chryseobacterium carnipullorum]MDN5479631.1 dihydrodipicolinate synthase family protein [Chryseobacterium sp.]AZA50201.1 dihydrodipicolinate synthase family protein [Chryseobacterium carnipullorum]AZA65073.1 dihydrodipicolinate synthase family protein [Chryseobacterium carnipullorum]SHM41268.1 4-hydroxy-tetrahydrodipicolinate synthase [Chryseobacterium carnipullorum]STC97746.1 Dihydrodipicolinate synthase [Chryseobacterium carnipullorum]